MAKKEKKGGGARKIGRNKEKCASYRNFHQREKNKVVRIAESCGLRAAMVYAEAKNIYSWAKERLKKRRRQPWVA